MSRLVTYLISATVLGATLASGPAAFAQPAAPQTPAAAPAPAPAIIVTEAYSEADARAVLNARLAALKAVIELTPEQEKLWPPLEAAIRDISKNAVARRKQMETAQPPKDFLGVLDQIGTAEEIRGRELKRFVEAARPFVASLTEAQKRRIPPFLGLQDTGGAHQPAGTLWLFEEEAG
ncbi:Spy/CpxP family protein refolding chaperone [Azorhizobium caulinodans]|uniref:Spy/CpxP family protein refolding chaperone n=1 Tax=Azorhizobium caulinodans TaxID=7 RepID=UPI002FBF03A6